MAQPLEPLFLDLTLFDFDDLKFVKATIKADGIELGASPISVPNITGGNYFFQDLALVFPTGRFEVITLYEVFDDAAFLTRSKKHAPAKDTLRLTTLPPGGDPAIIEKINQLIAIVTSHDLNSALVGTVEMESNIVGFIIPDVVIGLVPDDINLVGIALNNELIGFVDQNNELIGFVE